MSNTDHHHVFIKPTEHGILFNVFAVSAVMMAVGLLAGHFLG